MDLPDPRKAVPAPDRLPHLAAFLLLAASTVATAETPLPDPVPPAVIGRPLDQIRPSRPVRPQKSVAAKPNRPKPVVIGAAKTVPKPAPAAPAATAAMGAPAAATATVAPTAPAAAATPLPAAAQATPEAAPSPKVERDVAEPRTPIVDNVGQAGPLGTKPTAPGVYFGAKAQAVVRSFYAAHPKSARAPKWRIGEPVPPRTAMTGVPDEVRAALPAVPPGHQYVQLDDEVVLVAVPSRMVVDGIPRAMR
jgi:Ni/Co efflux regulator RcnB